MTDHPGRNNQLIRQWNILMKLASHRSTGVAIADLVEEHQVTRRTIERDLACLSEAGFALGALRQEGVQKYWGLIGPSPDLPPFPLDQDELIAVWMAAGLFLFFEGTPYKAGIDRLRDRLASILPPRLVAKLEDIQEHFLPLVHQRAIYQEKIELLSKLNKAILGQYKCRMSYFNPAWKEPREYQIQPCGMVVHRQILYLAALVEPRCEEPIIFSVRRIQNVELTSERFELPEGFSLAERVNRNFGIFQGEPKKIRVRFDPEVAHYPSEINFHPTQRNKHNRDGSVDVSMTVGGLQEVVWWVLSYTDHVQVLDPPELADLVRDTAKRIARKYGGR